MKYSNKHLIYDDHCPLCRWYSAQFVRFGLLQPENRIPFSKASSETLAAIDFNRATDEIPFVDPNTKEVTYGIDALLEILSTKCPIIGKIGQQKQIHQFLQKLYKLVSLNRKVIVAVKCGDNEIDCSPSFSIRYRWLFILLGTIFVFAASKLLYFSIVRTYWLSLSYQQFLLASSIFGFVSYSPALFLSREKSLEFLGQHTVLGIILTISLIVINAIQLLVPLDDLIVYLFHLVVGYMLIMEYGRRMSYINFMKQYKLVLYANYSTLAGFLSLLLINSSK